MGAVLWNEIKLGSSVWQVIKLASPVCALKCWIMQTIKFMLNIVMPTQYCDRHTEQ